MLHRMFRFSIRMSEINQKGRLEFTVPSGMEEKNKLLDIVSFVVSIS